MTSTGRSLALAGLLLLPAMTVRGQISVDLRPVAPGSDELLLEWAADPSLTGPFHLLRGFVGEGSRVADLLPLDPLVHRWNADISSPHLLSRGADGPILSETAIFQVVSENGGCSNLTYIIKQAAPPPGAPPLLLVNVPWRGGLRTLSGLLDDQPQLAGTATLLSARTGPIRRVLRRTTGGGVQGIDDFVPQGAAVFVYPGSSDPLILVGAAEPAKSGITTGFYPAALLSVPIATPLRRAVELLCGEEGLDWTAPPGQDFPDDCPNGLYDPATALTNTVQHFVPGSGFQGFTAFHAGHVRFIGSNFDLDPFSGIVENPSVESIPMSNWRPSDLGARAACACADGDGDGTDDCTEALIGTDPTDPASHGPDHDRDGLIDDQDPCPGVFDPSAADADGDGLGDPCDPCPFGEPACEDPDEDGIPRHFDLCPTVADPMQRDSDQDGLGDECDPCPQHFDLIVPVPDGDGDGVGDDCDCDSADAGAWSPPARLSGLRLSHRRLTPDIDWTGLVWNDLGSAHGPGTSYDLARGSLDSLWLEGLAESATCHRSSWPDADFLEMDPGSFWYVVRPRNSCGAASWSAPRSSSGLDEVDPCP